MRITRRGLLALIPAALLPKPKAEASLRGLAYFAAPTLAADASAFSRVHIELLRQEGFNQLARAPYQSCDFFLLPSGAFTPSRKSAHLRAPR
jgi:hypothetical protein